MPATTRRAAVTAVFAASFCASIAHAAGEPVPPHHARGLVFLDDNADGVRQPSERGVPNVLVTNGQDIVKTDTRGAYKIALPDPDDTTIAVIDPAGYTSPVDALGLPRFYYIHKPAGSPDASYVYMGVPPTGELPASIDFPLTRDLTGSTYDVLLVADPQPYTPEEVSLYGRDVVSELKGRDAAFTIALGDLVGNDLGLFPIYNQTNALSGHTWRNVYGNHDMNFMSPDDKHAAETFQQHFGPTDYAFYRGEALFIVLDTVFWKGFQGLRADGDPKRGNYTGAVSDAQIAFVRNLLDHTPEQTLVVISTHIPFMGDIPADNTQNFEKLLAAMSTHPNTLSLSGHTHKQRHEFFGSESGYTPAAGTAHHHYNVGTASGTWWKGSRSERGIPHAMMRDGTPNGFATLSIDGNRYSIRYKAAGFPESYQMNIVSPDESSGGDTFTANVFNGNERTTVEFRVGDSGPWTPMTRAPIPDPSYTAMVEQETGQTDRPKLNKPDVSTHIWQATLPANLTPGTAWLQVRATDEYGHIDTASAPLRVPTPERSASK